MGTSSVGDKTGGKMSLLITDKNRLNPPETKIGNRFLKPLLPHP